MAGLNIRFPKLPPYNPMKADRASAEAPALPLMRNVRNNSAIFKLILIMKECYCVNMDGKRTTKSRMQDNRNDNYVPGTPEERIGLVWPLNREIASLSVKHNAERRLRRHVTGIVRRECSISGSTGPRRLRTGRALECPYPRSRGRALKNGTGRGVGIALRARTTAA